MNYDINVGFGRIDITPPLGTNLRGYFHQRIADGILDPILATAIAVNKNDKTVILCSMDTIGATNEFLLEARQLISSQLGVDVDSVFLHSTHSHVAPRLGTIDPPTNELDKIYYKNAILKVADACRLAFEDLKPAKMGFAFSKAERVAFNRRYLMKDGSTRTNPGVNNPDIVKSIGLLDETLNVIRFTRECGDNIVVGNFGNHPDVIGGNKISADWPGLSARLFEKAVDNTKCIFFNGAQGDINHVNVRPVGGDLNGMFNDFDDVTRGYTHAKHIANVIAGGMMCVYEKVEYIDVNDIDFLQTDIKVASNMPTPDDDMELAYKIKKYHEEGRDDELPYKGMMLTTMLADSKRKIRLEHGPEFFDFHFTLIRIGDIAFVGIPGEPFAGVGIGLKTAKNYKMILPCCLTNGYLGYFPMKDSYDEGGYEAKCSSFKSGVAETIIEEGLKLLEKIR